MNVLSENEQLAKLRSGFLAKRHRLLIGGEWVEAMTGGSFEVVDPATGEWLSEVALGDAADIDRAVKAARMAFTTGAWPQASAAERAALLLQLAALVERHAGELAMIETLDGGNPLVSTRHVDVSFSASRLRSVAGWADKVMGEVPMNTSDEAGFAYVTREPVGVVAAITPWNAGLVMAVGKIAPALAMGCTVVLKPAELAPLSAIRLGELITEVGFPPGVVNIVTGYGHGAGQALSEHPEVDKISFTGSTDVGRAILAANGGNLKRVTLELGGKSPIIVFDDADLEAAAAAIVGEICFKTGQYCAAGTRLLVQSSVIDRLIPMIAAMMEAITVGGGLDDGSGMGPIVSQRQLDRVLGYIEAGVRDGARLVAGGHRIDRAGYFIEPTLLTGVEPWMTVFRDEIFGPVLCVTEFEDADDLSGIADLANDTDYGLAAKIWTHDLGRAHGLARRIKAGLVTVNGGSSDRELPYGGFKQSGLGREAGREGVLAFTELKSVSISYAGS